MDSNQHDHDENADIGLRQSNQRPSRGLPPADEPLERLAVGDLLVGADAIRAFLMELGIPRKTADPYYLKRAGRWPIGNTGGEGGKIIASKRRLLRHLEKIRAARLPPDRISKQNPEHRRQNRVKGGAGLKIKKVSWCNSPNIGDRGRIVNTSTGLS